MILDEIVLDNFGVYAGRQKIDLAPPDPTRPIVLIGGLNGGGKTTLLDGLMLALYGKRARCSNRGTLSYEEYLRRSIHRGSDPKSGARLELQLRHHEEGREHIYRVHRSWTSNGSGVRERVEVFKDGDLDGALTDTWSDWMEDLIPVRISELFFFDGEKIEAFADQQLSSQLLSSGVHTLLGLDLVDQLHTDLLVVERRKRAEAAPAADRREIDKLVAELEGLGGKRENLVDERAALQTAADRAKKRLSAVEARLKKEGGELYERRSDFESERRATAEQLAVVEEDLRDLATGVAPILLVEDLLRETLDQAESEEDAAQCVMVNRVLKKRDAALLRAMKSKGAGAKVMRMVREYLDADRQKRQRSSSGRHYLRLTAAGRDALASIVRGVGAQASERVAQLLERADDLRGRIEQLDRTLASIPDRDSIGSLLAQREVERANVHDGHKRLDILDAELARIAAEDARLRESIQRKLAKMGDSALETEDNARIVHHAQRVRKTLERFRSAVVGRHIARIERLVLESFQHLVRKQSLVSQLRVDPEELRIEIFGADHEILSPERLSAGERQLLAVSMLWGLARASKRPLPAIIDTPLGRLDSSHRMHLVERYFPKASHQVMLLSTDEEIDEEHYSRIKRRVGRAYRLEFDDRRRATTVRRGYFWD